MSKGSDQRRLRRNGDKERAWRERIADQKRGGGTVRAFCRERGLNENSFYHWRREIRLRDRENTAVPSRRTVTTSDASGRPAKLAPVVVIDQPSAATLDEERSGAISSSQSSTAIEVVLGDGTTVWVPHGATRQQLATVLAVLESTRC